MWRNRISSHLLAIIILLAVLLVGTLRPVNLGALAFVATFAVGGFIAREDVKTIYSGFPPDLFVLLFGVTYLFGIASVNGTIEWLVNSVARLVPGKAAMVPSVIFILSAIPTTLGALGPAAVALLAPIFLRLSKKYDINPLLGGLIVAHGSSAGNFSPLNPLGAIVNGTVEQSGLTSNPMALFAANFAYNAVLGVVIYVSFGGIELVRRTRARAVVPVAVSEIVARAEPMQNKTEMNDDVTILAEVKSEASTDITIVRVVTLACIVVVAVGTLFFKLDLGMLAVSGAVLLHLLFSSTSEGALNKVSWSTVLLICGVVAYMALLQRMGTIRMVGESVAGVGAPLLGAFLICSIAAVTSAFASSTGMLGVLIPLSVPLLSTGEVGVAGVVIALAISATVVDASPFSSLGALVLANCPETEQERLFRGFFLWGIAMVLTAPVATWVLFVLNG